MSLKPKLPPFKKTLTKLKRRLLSHPRAIRTILIISFLALIIFTATKTLTPLINLETPTQFISAFLKPASHLRQTHNRTNFILLGIGGAAHEAGDLTDTIIFVSLNLETGDTLLLPLPRDLWVSSLRAKLNTAYHYGKEKKPSTGGLILAKAAVGEILDQPVHYAVVVNFDAFQDLVDLVGGVQINVPRTFDDYYYPIPGMEDAQPEELRYQHLHFDAGPQHMNGTTALKFARSRHSQDQQEGTDFARSQRQQLVILSLKDKLLSPKFLLKPKNIQSLISIADQHLQTDLSPSSYPALARLALKFDSEKLRTSQLSSSTPESPNPQALLINPPISSDHDDQWVLVPQDEDWSQIHAFVECLLYSQTDCQENAK